MRNQSHAFLSLRLMYEYDISATYSDGGCLGYIPLQEFVEYIYIYVSGGGVAGKAREKLTLCEKWQRYF
jgi:hypothetical protein